MAGLIRLYNEAPAPAPTAPASKPSGLIRLFKDAPKPTPAPAPVQANAPDYNQPKYGAAGVKDNSGKPLETFNNPKASQTQLLRDRVYPSFDPTKPQKLNPSHLTNGRIPESVSGPIKKELGGSYS